MRRSAGAELAGKLLIDLQECFLIKIGIESLEVWNQQMYSIVKKKQARPSR